VRPGQIKPLERRLPRSAVLVEGKAEHGQPTAGISRVKPSQRGKLLFACPAPTCPEVDHRVLGAAICECAAASIGALEAKRRRVADRWDGHDLHPDVWQGHLPAP